MYARLSLSILLLLLAACSAPPPAPTPTPDLQATVAAAVQAALPTATPMPTPDIEATVSARMEATVAAMPTATPIPTPTFTPTPTPLPTATPIVTPTPTPDPEALFARMIERVRHSVVRVEHAQGSGSGVIFETTDTGTALIATNAHVVGGYTQVDVTVDDATTYTGTVRGVDATRDLAVVTICCRDFLSLPFGTVEVGEQIVVMGYALGLPGKASVTRGIVSAIRFSEHHQSNVIQTDAATNPGNSGGPMLNLQGEIVGIHTFGIDWASVDRPAEGLGFGISADSAQYRVHELKTMQPPTPTPVSPTATPTPASRVIFGPRVVALSHDPDEYIEVWRAGVYVADAIISARFVNPYSASSQRWANGFIIGDSESNSKTELMVVVAAEPSGSWWNISSYTEINGWNTISEGTTHVINRSVDEKNTVEVITRESRVSLSINGTHITTQYVPASTYTGDIAVATGMWDASERVGAITFVEDFTIWE